MSALRFNPLTYANKLKEVGMEPQQAEKLAQLQEEIIENVDINTLATRQDILLLKDSIYASKSELKDLIHTTENNLIKWMIGLLLAQSGLLLGIASFIIKN